MRAPDAFWVSKAMTAVRHPDHPGAGVLVRLGSGAVIFIPTGLLSARPTVTNENTPAVCSADCLRVMTGVPQGCREDFPTVVMTAVHLKPDLKGGSGVFAMAVKRCVFL